MERIRFLRTLRAVEREARARGFYGDPLARYEDIPLVGTFRQQWAIATIGVDCSPGQMSTRDRALLNRLVRAAVLTSPAEPEFYERVPQQAPARGRKW